MFGARARDDARVCREIYLNDNALTELPSSLAALHSLKTLVLNYNKLTRLPEVVCYYMGRRTVRPPVLVQEYVNHGGQMLKCYFAAGRVHVAARPSLPDLRSGAPGTPAAVRFDSQRMPLAEAFGECCERSASRCEQAANSRTRTAEDAPPTATQRPRASQHHLRAKFTVDVRVLPGRGVATPPAGLAPGRFHSQFLDKNRRGTGKSQPESADIDNDLT